MTSRHESGGILYEPPGRLATHQREIAWGLFLLALLLRLVYLWQLHGTPFWEDLAVDIGYYRDWAHRIAAGGAPAEVYEQSPFYAWFLAALFRFPGEGFLAPRLLQVIVGSITCVLVYQIGTRVFSPVSGLIAGLMAAFYGPFLFYDGMLMKGVFGVFFITLMTWQLVISDGWKRGVLVMAGVSLGLGALVRDNLILLAPLVAVWLLFDTFIGSARLHGGHLKDGFISSVCFAGGALLIVAPVTARNFNVSGEFVLLTAGGGEVLYIGNNAGADGYYSPPPFVRAGSVVEHEDFRIEAARRLGRPLDEITRKEASDYWLSMAFDWAVSNPADFLQLTARKILIFWNHYELPDNHNYSHHRRLIPLLNLPLLTFGLLAPLAAAGVVLSATRWRELLPLYAIGAGYMATVILFFNFGRFRLPLVPILLVFAGEAAAGFYHTVSKRRLGRALAAAGIGLALFLVTSRDLKTDKVHVGQGRAQLARILYDAGRLKEADEESLESISLLEGFFTDNGGALGEGGHGPASPDQAARPPLGESFYIILGEACATRAAILRERGQDAEAVAWDGYARLSKPDLFGAHPGAEAAELMRLGQEQVLQGEFGSAAATFTRALEIASLPGSPADPRTRLSIALHLAEATHRAGDPQAALRIVEEALDGMESIPPVDLAAAHFGKALIYRDLGETEWMVFSMRECLRLNPDHPRAEWMRRILAEQSP